MNVFTRLAGKVGEYTIILTKNSFKMQNVLIETVYYKKGNQYNNTIFQKENKRKTAEATIQFKITFSYYKNLVNNMLVLFLLAYQLTYFYFLILLQILNHLFVFLA